MVEPERDFVLWFVFLLFGVVSSREHWDGIWSGVQGLVCVDADVPLDLHGRCSELEWKELPCFVVLVGDLDAFLLCVVLEDALHDGEVQIGWFEIRVLDLIVLAANDTEDTSKGLGGEVFWLVVWSGPRVWIGWAFSGQDSCEIQFA